MGRFFVISIFTSWITPLLKYDYTILMIASVLQVKLESLEWLFFQLYNPCLQMFRFLADFRLFKFFGTIFVNRPEPLRNFLTKK